MLEFAEWLQATPFSVAIQSTLWVTPLVQTIHIMMIGIVFVSMLIVALRVLGHIRADEPLADVWRRFAPWFWSALCVMAATGVVLTISEPIREFTALSFWLKMALLVIGIVSALSFGRVIRAATGRGESGFVGQGAGRCRGDGAPLGRDHVPGPLDRLRRRDLAVVAPRVSSLPKKTDHKKDERGSDSPCRGCPELSFE